MKLLLARLGLLQLSEGDVNQLAAAGEITDRDLVYAAWAKCGCGHGLAHVRGARFWDCSALLLDPMLSPIGHEDRLLFSYYTIPAEGDPHCPGETTRPRRAA